MGLKALGAQGNRRCGSELLWEKKVIMLIGQRADSVGYRDCQEIIGLQIGGRGINQTLIILKDSIIVMLQDRRVVLLNITIFLM